MRRRDETRLLSILVGIGLYLLDPLRDRLADQIDSLSDRAKGVLDTVSGRARKVSRATTVEDRSGIGSTAALFPGVGVGVTLGLLVASASGDQSGVTVPTRSRNSEDEFAVGCQASQAEPQPTNVRTGSSESCT